MPRSGWRRAFLGNKSDYRQKARGRPFACVVGATVIATMRAPTPPSSSSPRYTALSTFSGLGGLDLGLEASGFTVVGCVETDPATCRSLKANRGDDWPLLAPGDIAELARTLSPADLALTPGELDLLAGAPPCQPYSTAGQWADSARRGLIDDRGKLLFDFLDLAARFQPKVLLLENVPGFLSGPASALEALESQLRNLNAVVKIPYEIHAEVLDAADFGVPQHRRRAIIVMVQSNLEFEMPEVVEDAARRTAWDAIGHISCEDPPEPGGKWAELLPSIPEGHNYQWHTRKGGGAALFGYRTRYWSFLLKLSRDRPAWTIPASPGPSTGPFHWDNRPLTIEELLCLQSFPQDWIVEGNRREQVRQVGNATPPLLAELVGNQILKALGGTGSGEPPNLAIPAANPTWEPLAISAVPDKFVHLAGEHLDHPGSGQGPRPRSAS